MVRSLLLLCCAIFPPDIVFANAKGSGQVNIALSMRVRQSSIHRPYGAAEHAVDGREDPVYVHHSCTHTDVKGILPEWWEVDLQKDYILGKVRILNRETDVYRLHDLTIEVFGNIKEPRGKKLCAKHDGPAGEGWLSVDCEPPVIGRYVRITKPKNNVTDVLTMCEVKIFETITSRSWYFQEESSAALSQGTERMTRSALHCGVTWLSTSGQAGFSVEEKEDHVYCHMLTAESDAGGHLKRRSGTSYIPYKDN